MSNRILITGGSSFLGQHLLPLAPPQNQTLYTYFNHVPAGLPGNGRPLDGRQLDLRDSEATLELVSDWQPQVIIHLAGSDRSEDMTAVICRGAENIVQAAQAANARLIHLSSDVIFDGRSGPHPESAPPSPIHAYGAAKAAAESIVAAYANHVIVRTSLIYSLTQMDHGTKWLVSALQAGQPVTLFDDQFRNPVWAETLARACLELVDLDFRGILNVAGSQELSRAEFGLKMLDWWGIQERATLSSGPSPETWPKDCRLDVSLAVRLLSTPMLGVDAVVAAQKSL
jgi:dTDP-4-dehydrorhamnose reductase